MGLLMKLMVNGAHGLTLTKLSTLQWNTETTGTHIMLWFAKERSTHHSPFKGFLLTSSRLWGLHLPRVLCVGFTTTLWRLHVFPQVRHTDAIKLFFGCCLFPYQPFYQSVFQKLLVQIAELMEVSVWGTNRRLCQRLSVLWHSFCIYRLCVVKTL